MIEKIDTYLISIYENKRGLVWSLNDLKVKNLHIFSLNPGSIRGNHFHECKEVMCIIGGARIWEILIEDKSLKTFERIPVNENMEWYIIDRGIFHTVKNTGDRIFYLVCFNI